MYFSIRRNIFCPRGLINLCHQKLLLPLHDKHRNKPKVFPISILSSRRSFNTATRINWNCLKCVLNKFFLIAEKKSFDRIEPGLTNPSWSGSKLHTWIAENMEFFPIVNRAFRVRVIIKYLDRATPIWLLNKIPIFNNSQPSWNRFVIVF